MSTTELMQQRIAELFESREAVLAEAQPLEEKRATLLREIDAIRAKENALIDKIKKVKAPLADIDAELSRLNMATGGKRLGR